MKKIRNAKYQIGQVVKHRLYAFRGDNGQKLYTSAPMKGLRHFETLIATASPVHWSKQPAVAEREE